MPQHYTTKLTANHNGANAYLGPEYLHDSTNPLRVGEQHEIITIPHQAVVIAPAGSLELPEHLTVRDPRLDDPHPR